MAPKYPVKQEYFFYDQNWTEATDKLFIEVLVDQHAIDNFHPRDENKLAVQIAMDVMNKEFNKSFTYDFCTARLSTLEKRYRTFYWVKRKHGVTYYEAENTVIANEEVWADIFRRDPFTLAYQEFGEPRWNELRVLFDGLFSYDPNEQPEVIEISSDSETDEIGNLEGLPSPPIKSNIVNISSSESKGASSFWKYLEQFAGGYESVSESSVNQPLPHVDLASASRPPNAPTPKRIPCMPRRPYFSSPCKSSKSVGSSGSSSRPP